MSLSFEIQEISQSWHPRNISVSMSLDLILTSNIYPCHIESQSWSWQKSATHPHRFFFSLGFVIETYIFSFLVSSLRFIHLQCLFRSGCRDSDLFSLSLGVGIVIETQTFLVLILLSESGLADPNLVPLSPMMSLQPSCMSFRGILLAPPTWHKNRDWINEM